MLHWWVLVRAVWDVRRKMWWCLENIEDIYLCYSKLSVMMCYYYKVNVFAEFIRGSIMYISNYLPITSQGRIWLSSLVIYFCIKYNIIRLDLIDSEKISRVNYFEIKLAAQIWWGGRYFTVMHLFIKLLQGKCSGSHLLESKMMWLNLFRICSSLLLFRIIFISKMKKYKLTIKIKYKLKTDTPLGPQLLDYANCMVRRYAL